MRRPCLQCFRKHLGNAQVLIEEVADGYPYRMGVVGHLDQAAQEIRGYSDELAHVVRAHRIKWQQDNGYDIPFEELDAFIDDLEFLWSKYETDSTKKESFPEIPEGCYRGLDKLASGEGYNLMLGDMRSLK